MRDEREVREPETGERAAVPARGRRFVEREVAIVPGGEPGPERDPWGRIAAAIAARRRVCAPAAVRERIMAAIEAMPLA